jgi:hypothetical protein
MVSGSSTSTSKIRHPHKQSVAFAAQHNNGKSTTRFADPPPMVDIIHAHRGGRVVADFCLEVHAARRTEGQRVGVVQPGGLAENPGVAVGGARCVRVVLPGDCVSAAIKARRARPCGVCVAASIAASSAARLACGSRAWTISMVSTPCSRP